MNFRHYSILALVLVTLGFSPLYAQTALNTTTLAAAVAIGDQQVRLTSTSTVAANDVLYVDQEAMQVRSVNSPYVQVSRGIDGTGAVAHNTLGLVYTGPRIRFAQPRPRRGSCTRTSETYLPRVVPSVGEIWDCPAAAGVWTMLSGNVPAMVVECRAGLVTAMIDQSCFIADRPYYVSKITYVSTVVEAGGTLTIIPRKQTGTQAVASGTALATALSGVSTVAQTVTPFVLTATTSALILNTGDRLGLDFTDDVAGELAGVVVAFTLIPQ